MTSRSEKTERILDLMDAEEAAQALRLARQAKSQLEDMNANAKVLARVMVTHFDAYEAEIARLSKLVQDCDQQALIRANSANIRLQQDVKRLEEEVKILNNELKAIDRQRRQERETW
jgi:hypothetical protein